MSRLFGWAAFLSASIGFALFLALHFLKSELAPDWHMVSEYALGRHGWAMTLCFACLSLSCLSLALAIFTFLRAAGGKIGLVLLVCSATGLALAAAFPTDPITVPPSGASYSARLHGLSVLAGVPALTIAALLISYPIVSNPIWANGRLRILVFAHLVWTSLALTAIVVAETLPASGGFGPEVPVGWPNRLMFISYFGWLGTVSWPLMKPPGVSE